MGNFTPVASTHLCTTGQEFSIAHGPSGANFNSGSPITTTGYVAVWLDLDTLVAGDVLEIRVYKSVAGGALVADDVATVQTAQRWYRFVGLVQGNWDITVKITSANSRTIGFEVTVDTNDVNAATISNGAIAAATFAAGAITNTVLAANAITSSIIAASAIGASQIASAALTAAAFATDAIAGGTVAASAVTKIQSGLALTGDVTTILGRLPAALVGGRMSSDVGSWLGTAAATPTVAGIPKVEDATMQARIDATRAAKIDQLDAAVTSRAPATDTGTLLTRISAIRAGLLDNLDIASSSIAAAAASAVWATISEGTETVLQALRLIVARAAGGGGVQDGDGLYAWKSQDGTKTRVGLQRTGNAISSVTRDGT